MNTIVRCITALATWLRYDYSSALAGGFDWLLWYRTLQMTVSELLCP